jgi:hypothetical protein
VARDAARSSISGVFPMASITLAAKGMGES